MSDPTKRSSKWKSRERTDRCLPLLTLAASLVVVLAAVPSFASSPEDVARRFLTSVYEGRFDERTPAVEGTQRFERRARNVLRVRCFRVEGIAVSGIQQEQTKASVTLQVALSKSDPQKPDEWTPVEIVPLRIELIATSEGTWQVSSVRNLDEELAERLLGPEGGESLLHSDPERISKGLARAMYERAIASLNSGKSEDAARASALARQIAILAGDRGGEALALGAAIHTASSPQVALQLSSESLALAEIAGEQDVLSRAWYDRGRAMSNQGWSARDHITDRIECFRKAYQLAERAEDPTLLIRASYSLANITANAQCDYLTARRYIETALPVAREVGDAVGEMGLETVLTTIYLEQADPERARFHHSRALELAKKLRAAGYGALQVRSAILLVGEGRFDEAHAEFSRILVRTNSGVTTTIGGVPKSVVGNALRALAAIEQERGNLSEAECLVRESAMYLGASPNAYLHDLSGHYMKEGNPAAALSMSLASLMETRLFSEEKVRALTSAGRAYRKMGEVERGLAMALEAIEIREGIDTRVSGDEVQRVRAHQLSAECYELAAELALDRGNTGEALAFLERGRAMVLTDIVENGRPAALTEADATLHEEQIRLEHDLAQLVQDLDRARAAGDEHAQAVVSEQLRHTRATHASFVDGVLARSERRQATRRLIEPSAIVDFAKRFPPGTAAVVYFLTDEQLHIFVLGRDASGQQHLFSRTKNIDRETLAQDVNTFVETLSSIDLRTEKASRRLYELLIEPIETDLDGIERLLIVPAEILWRVPFSALVDRRGQYLVQRSSIVYAPSIMAYAAIAESARKISAGPVSMLAIGNPTLEQHTSEDVTSFYRDATLGPLPDAEREVDSLREVYGRQHSLVLKRGEATEARTKSSIGGATVVHFATHALLDDANPMYSRLAMAHDAGVSDDGWLEGWEVARLDLSADIVVLSACETARGRVGGGEGVIGMAWSFFLAGAHSTLSTQWKIASHSTAQLMIAFHRSLRAKRGEAFFAKAEALREAQLQLIRNKQTRHPFYWAAFVLIGDPSSSRLTRR